MCYIGFLIDEGQKMKRPKGATHEHNGLFFKRGIHGHVYFYKDDGWYKSTQPWSDVIAIDVSKY